MSIAGGLNNPAVSSGEFNPQRANDNIRPLAF